MNHALEQYLDHSLASLTHETRTQATHRKSIALMACYLDSDLTQKDRNWVQAAADLIPITTPPAEFITVLRYLIQEAVDE